MVSNRQRFERIESSIEQLTKGMNTLLQRVDSRQSTKNRGGENRQRRVREHDVDREARRNQQIRREVSRIHVEKESTLQEFSSQLGCRDRTRNQGVRRLGRRQRESAHEKRDKRCHNLNRQHDERYQRFGDVQRRLHRENGNPHRRKCQHDQHRENVKSMRTRKCCALREGSGKEQKQPAYAQREFEQVNLTTNLFDSVETCLVDSILEVNALPSLDQELKSEESYDSKAKEVINSNLPYELMVLFGFEENDSSVMVSNEDCDKVEDTNENGYNSHLFSQISVMDEKVQNDLDNLADHENVVVWDEDSNSAEEEIAVIWDNYDDGEETCEDNKNECLELVVMPTVKEGDDNEEYDHLIENIGQKSNELFVSAATLHDRDTLSKSDLVTLLYLEGRDGNLQSFGDTIMKLNSSSPTRKERHTIANQFQSEEATIGCGKCQRKAFHYQEGGIAHPSEALFESSCIHEGCLMTRSNKDSNIICMDPMLLEISYISWRMVRFKERDGVISSMRFVKNDDYATNAKLKHMGSSSILRKSVICGRFKKQKFKKVRRVKFKCLKTM